VSGRRSYVWQPLVRLANGSRTAKTITSATQAKPTTTTRSCFLISKVSGLSDQASSHQPHATDRRLPFAAPDFARNLAPDAKLVCSPPPDSLTASPLPCTRPNRAAFSMYSAHRVQHIFSAAPPCAKMGRRTVKMSRFLEREVPMFLALCHLFLSS
jgi:hypothetical protein